MFHFLASGEGLEISGLRLIPCQPLSSRCKVVYPCQVNHVASLGPAAWNLS